MSHKKMEHDGSPESWNNVRLVKNRQIYLWELADSDWALTPEGMKKKPFTLRTVEQDTHPFNTGETSYFP